VGESSCRKQIRRELGELDVGAPPKRTDPVSDETTCPMSRADCQLEFAFLARIADRSPGRRRPKHAPVPPPNEPRITKPCIPVHSSPSFPNPIEGHFMHFIADLVVAISVVVFRALLTVDDIQVNEVNCDDHGPFDSDEWRFNSPCLSNIIF
jgi:hypothetical protein